MSRPVEFGNEDPEDDGFDDINESRFLDAYVILVDPTSMGYNCVDYSFLRQFAPSPKGFVEDDAYPEEGIGVACFLCLYKPDEAQGQLPGPASRHAGFGLEQQMFLAEDYGDLYEKDRSLETISTTIAVGETACILKTVFSTTAEQYEEVAASVAFSGDEPLVILAFGVDRIDGADVISVIRLYHRADFPLEWALREIAYLERTLPGLN